MNLAEQFDLLNVPVVESPRLKWLKRHRIKTHATSLEVGAEDEYGEEISPFYAYVGKNEIENAHNIVGGTTEDEAIRNLAIRKGWLLWNEETI